MLKERLRQLWLSLMDRLGFVPKIAESLLRKDLQPVEDLQRINYLDVGAGKLTNLACVEATNDITSDSAVCEPLKALSKVLEDKKADIVYGALTKGGFYMVPYFDDTGELQLMMLSSDYVKVTKRMGDKIREAYVILESYTTSDYGTTYFLMRHHRLDENGCLYIDYTVMQGTQKKGAEQLSKKIPSFWQEIVKSGTTYNGVNHIGFGYYRSPVQTRGIATDEGVPLDFGCAEIINQLRELRREFDEEYRNAKSIIFADPRMLSEDEKTKQYKIIENIIAVNRKAGIDGDMINVYNPTIRFNELHDREQSLYADLENQMKLSRGIFTENAFTKDATATEVKRSNKDTIAMIDSIHNMLDIGDEMTLTACGIYLNIRRDLWEYTSDYFDPFDDAGEQWNYLKAAYDAGAVSLKHLAKWLNPSATDEEIEQEIEEAKAERQGSTNNALFNALNM